MPSACTGCTVTVQVSWIPVPATLTVMVAVPADTAVTNPFASTAATNGSEDSHSVPCLTRFPEAPLPSVSGYHPHSMYNCFRVY